MEIHRRKKELVQRLRDLEQSIDPWEIANTLLHRKRLEILRLRGTNSEDRDAIHVSLATGRVPLSAAKFKVLEFSKQVDKTTPSVVNIISIFSLGYLSCK